MPIRPVLAVAALAAVLAAGPAGAATTGATPATLERTLAGARPGDTIRLAPGTYGALQLRDKTWSPPVTVEAGAAQLTSVRLMKVSGLTWHGGTFDGGDAERAGISVAQGDHLIVDGTTMHHYLRVGIGLGSVSDARVVNNVFSDMGSDGIDIGLSRRIVVDHNRCTAFHPTEGAHPDCVQLWSRPAEPPTADIVVSNNEATGDMQGFTAFNHARPDASGKVVDDGGFDRITIANNVARVMQYHGVTVYDCRHCTVRGNRVETLTNPANPRIRAWIKTLRASDVTFCGNVAVAFPGDPGSERCR